MEIYVKMPDGEIITYDLLPSDTIEGIHKDIQDTERIPIGQQHLFFSERPLSSNYPLSFYNIKDKSTLVLRLRTDQSMRIFIQTNSRKVFDLSVDPNDTVEQVKT